MKTTSLKSIAPLAALLLMQVACGNGDKAKFEKGKQLEKQAITMLRLEEKDSARKCYLACISLYKELQGHVDSTSDTMYNHRLAYVYNQLGYSDSVNALSYFFESLKLARISNRASIRLADEKNIANYYFSLGYEKEGGSSEQKDMFEKSRQYMLIACREIDSADDKTPIAENIYENALHLFNKIGDTLNAKKYADKYFQLRKRN